MSKAGFSCVTSSLGGRYLFYVCTEESPWCHLGPQMVKSLSAQSLLPLHWPALSHLFNRPNCARPTQTRPCLQPQSRPASSQRHGVSFGHYLHSLFSTASLKQTSNLARSNTIIHYCPAKLEHPFNEMRLDLRVIFLCKV